MPTDGSRVRLGRRRALITIALVTALCAVGGYAQSSGAVGVTYCSNVYLAGFDHCDAPARHSLTANIAQNYSGASTIVCAGATLNGSFWGGYVCSGSGFAEHCYDGANLLVGRIHNGQSGAQHMIGSYYYSQACP
jgi:hypothetical protein